MNPAGTSLVGRRRPPIVLPGPGLLLPAAVVRPRQDLADYLEPYLGWLRLVRGRSPSTIEQYGRNLRLFLTFVDAVDRRRPEHVDHRLIEAYLGWLQSPAIGRQATTVIQHFYAIKSWCLYLSREGIISRNTSVDAFGPKKTVRLPHNYLSIDEQEALLRALQQRTTLLGRRDYALVSFALFAGARCEELATLPLAHVHLDAGRVLIHGKGSKDREVPLVPRLVANSPPVPRRGAAGAPRPLHRALPLRARSAGITLERRPASPLGGAHGGRHAQSGPGGAPPC